MQEANPTAHVVLEINDSFEPLYRKMLEKTNSISGIDAARLGRIHVSIFKLFGLTERERIIAVLQARTVSLMVRNSKVKMGGLGIERGQERDFLYIGVQPDYSLEIQIWRNILGYSRVKPVNHPHISLGFINRGICRELPGKYSRSMGYTLSGADDLSVTGAAVLLKSKTT